MTEHKFTVFSDEDLKWYKKQLDEHLGGSRFAFERMKAYGLLARLEAAEKALMNSEYQEVNEYFEAWRQAAGK